MKLKMKLALVSLIGLANLNGAVTATLTNGQLGVLDTDALTADNANVAGGINFTSDVAQATSANFTQSPATFTNLVATAPGEGATGFGFTLLDIFDGTGSKTLTATIETNWNRTIVLTVAEGAVVGGNTNPTLGFSQTGTFFWQVTTNGGTPEDSTTGVVLGQSQYTSVEFETTGGEYIKEVSFGVDLINSDGHDLVGVNFTSSPIPEPTSAALLGLGGLALLGRRKRA